jgi:hypothetical protein
MDLFSGKILWGLFKRECPSFIQRQDKIILRFPQDDGTTGNKKSRPSIGRK